MAYLIQNPGRNSDLLRALAEMLQEMQAHYDVPCPPCEEFLQGLMDRPEGSDILVMTDQNSVIGFAAFSGIAKLFEACWVLSRVRQFTPFQPCSQPTGKVRPFLRDGMRWLRDCSGGVGRSC